MRPGRSPIRSEWRYRLVGVTWTPIAAISARLPALPGELQVSPWWTTENPIWPQCRNRLMILVRHLISRRFRQVSGGICVSAVEIPI